MKKAVVFPFNKEIHSIVANTDLCSFDILGIFDTKYLGNVNKKISEVLPYCSNDNIIQNIEKLDWSLPFDTFATFAKVWLAINSSLFSSINL